MKKILISFLLFFIVSVSNGASTPGQLTFKFTPVTEFLCNDAVIAVYVIDNHSKFTKTLLLYSTSTFQSSLWQWKGRSKGNIVDATVKNEKLILTNNSYPQITCYWNSTDTLDNGTHVAQDGNYYIFMEIYYISGDHEDYDYCTFSKGSTAQNLTSVKTNSNSNWVFKDISLVWNPNLTAVDEVKLESLYSVYPNPATSSINISGEDVNSVEIYSILGQSLLYSKEKQVNISSLSKGNYLVRIMTNNGAVIKKIQKM
jgi:hypothetical protein